METETAYWLAWSQIKGIGAILLKRLQQHFSSLETAWQASIGELGEVEGFGGKLIESVREARSKIDPATLLAKHQQENPLFWTPGTAEYPRLLEEIPSPPPLLYYRGQPNSEENRGMTPLIGIVGTRSPSEYGKRWTQKITTSLVQHGFGIVSGMAAGIDTVAHTSCLAAGGRTIAVLGTGVDIIYPYSNRQLYREISDRGLIVSEYPTQTQPEKGNFPARNRIIAGLCRAIIIMEAPIKSGALITARFANDFCRDVYILPGSLDNQNAYGCLELLSRGAQVILSPEHLLEMLGTMPQLDLPKTNITLPDNLPTELVTILQTISPEAVALDTISQTTGFDAGKLLAALSQLELMGLISQLPGMRYQKN
jgi:DNA processing protein